MDLNEIIKALKAFRLVAATSEWSVPDGTDQTGWNSCAECGEDDFRGHKPGCIMPKLFSDFDAAVQTLESWN